MNKKREIIPLFICSAHPQKVKKIWLVHIAKPAISKKKERQTILFIWKNLKSSH